MRFTCIKSDLIKALSNTSRVAAAKNSIAALDGVLIKAYDSKLNISGYNLEIGITTDIDANIQSEGEIVISAKLFLDIVRKLPEEIIIIDTDERLVTYIACGNVNYQIVGMSPKDYPELPTFEQRESITVNAKILCEMIRQTVYAVSENTTKPIFTGSLFEIENGNFRIVAIDGYRMAIRKENINCESKTSFVVPGKTQQEILKLATESEENIEISVGQRHIAFKIGNYRVISRLVEGTFLDYKSAIPKKSSSEIIISKRKLIDLLERMALLTDTKVQAPIKCLFTENEIKFSCASTKGKASESISAKIDGNPEEIGFNCRYMLDALKNTDTDEIRILLIGSAAPIIIKSVKGDSFLCFVLPMRLQGAK